VGPPERVGLDQLDRGGRRRRAGAGRPRHHRRRADLARLDLPVVAGFSTHPHWDHLLWHERFGDVPRHATADGVRFAAETIEQQREGALEEGGPDVPVDLIARITPLPADREAVPGGTLVEHRAHCVGHAAVVLADRGVLLAGDMLSDILIPLFDPHQDDQLGAYDHALSALGAVLDANPITIAVPGHGSVATGDAIAARLAADRAYVDALRAGAEPDDPRFAAHDWLDGPHRFNQRQVAG
jgi:hypothetical protein